MGGRIAVTVLLTACFVMGAVQSGYAQSPGASTKVRVSLNGYENNITPFTLTFAASPNSNELVHLIYDSLFWSQRGETPESWLAEKAEPSADRKNWTVTLVNGVKWQDGKPFTAADVKFTFEYFLKYADLSGRYGHHLAGFPQFERAQVLNDRQVRLFFKTPAPSFRLLPGADLPMIPKHIWEGIIEPTRALENSPIGTGPYKLAQITADQRYSLVANKGYFKGEPLVDEIELPIHVDAASAFDALSKNEVDLVARNTPHEMLGTLKANPDLKVVRGTKLESVQLNFNAKKAPFSDARVRKALSLAIDSEAVVKTVLGGNGRPGVDSFIHPLSPWALKGAKHEFDVARANSLLDSAGYNRRDSDGVRRGPDGKRMDFKVLFSSFEVQHLRALELVSQMHTGIGVRIAATATDPADLRAVRREPNPAYDAYVSLLDAHIHTDPDGLLYFFHSTRGIGQQITGYSNPRFDELAEKAAVTLKPAERRRILHEMQRIFAADAPSVPLYFPDEVLAYRAAVYDRWTPDRGHGVFTKRSFLKEYAREGAEIPGREGEGRVAWIFLAVVAGMVLIGSAFALLRRRPQEEAADELVSAELARTPDGQDPDKAPETGAQLEQPAEPETKTAPVPEAGEPEPVDAAGQGIAEPISPEPGGQAGPPEASDAVPVVEPGAQPEAAGPETGGDSPAPPPQEAEQGSQALEDKQEQEAAEPESTPPAGPQPG